MKKQLLFAFGTAVLLASCSNDIDSPSAENLYDGYLHVKGSIEQVKTRNTTNDTGFENGNQIGVSGGNIAVNVAYTYGDNSFTTTEDIKVSEDNVTFTAYYPYTETFKSGTSNEIEFDITSDNDKCDFLWAQAKELVSTNQPVADFTFAHKMAQLSFIVIDGTDEESLKDSEISIILQNIATTGVFNISTGDVKADSEKHNVTISGITAVTAENAKNAPGNTVIVPSYSTTPEAIKVILSVGEATYSGTINPALATGTKYSYTLTINGDSTFRDFSIKSSGITQWNAFQEEAEDIAITEDYVLKVGDFLLKSGETISPKQLSDENEDNVVGVVIYVGNTLPTDASDYTEAKDILWNEVYKTKLGYNTTSEVDWNEHGIALALKNAKDDADQFISKAYDFTTSWLNLDSNADSYIDLSQSDTKSAPSVKKGYNNTSIIKAAQTADSENVGAQTLIDLLTEFNSTYSVEKSSGWYLPSFAELALLNNTVEDVNELYDKVVASLKLVNSELKYYDQFPGSDTTLEMLYWSSDQVNGTYTWATGLMALTDASKYRIGKNSKSKRSGYFRFAIAF